MNAFDVDRLLFAVLERAIKDIVAYRVNTKSVSMDTYEDALDWFNREGEHVGSEAFVFSFYTICSRLDIDESRLRGKVNQIAEGDNDIPKHIMGGSLWKSKRYRRPSKLSSGCDFPGSSALLLPYKSISEVISWDTGYKGSNFYCGEATLQEDNQLEEYGDD